MNVESKILQVESLNQLPFDNVLSLFRQGYRLAEYNGLNIGLNVNKSLATCIGSVTKGGMLTLSATASSGTAPYAYHWTVTKPDGTTETLANQATNQYVVSQNGEYTVSVYVTDSCAAGMKTSNIDSCKVVVLEGEEATKYNCINGTCIGPYKVGTYDSIQKCIDSGCEAGGGGAIGCIDCDPVNNYCISGNCIPKKYALASGIGLVALLILTR